MVYWAIGTVLLLLAFAGNDLRCHASGPLILRSFDQLVLECAELMAIAPSKLMKIRSGVMVRDGETKCMLRCVGVVGRFWNDRTGLRKDVLAQYFVTDPADVCNVNRTEKCLEKLPALTSTPHDCCELAFESFQCFYYNFGNLRQDCVFVPLDQLQLQHVTARCMDVHQITTEQLMSLSEEAMDTNEHVHCLVRCIGIQTGVYSDGYGVNVDRIYAQYGEGYCEETFKRNASECISRQSVFAYSSPCKRAYQLLYKCFESVHNVISAYEMQDSDEISAQRCC